MDEHKGAIQAPDTFRDVQHGGLLLAVESAVPLLVVPRSPSYVGLLRGASDFAAPNGSLHLERLPDAAPEGAQTPCLVARQPSLRRRSPRNWTLEANVLFLGTPHFGRHWQTIVAKTGFNLSAADPSNAALPILAAKLSPARRFVLQVWVDVESGPPILVTAQSVHQALPDTWYHLVMVSNGGTLDFYVNGGFELRLRTGGRLALPTRSTDGDLAFGCGMHQGVPADTCSCLLSEVRAAEQALTPEQWLWRRRDGYHSRGHG